MTDHPVVELKAVDPIGRGRIERWLRSPSVADWWGGTAAGEARVRLALTSEAAICRMVSLDGVPIGYGQAMDAIAGGASSDNLPPGTWECDLFIGEEIHRGRGYWSLALDQLATEVLSTTLALACAVVVPLRNERVARAAERIGFRWTRIIALPRGGPSWIMLRDRSNG